MDINFGRTHFNQCTSSIHFLNADEENLILVNLSKKLTFYHKATLLTLKSRDYTTNWVTLYSHPLTPITWPLASLFAHICFLLFSLQSSFTIHKGILSSLLYVLHSRHMQGPPNSQSQFQIPRRNMIVPRPTEHSRSPLWLGSRQISEKWDHHQFVPKVSPIGQHFKPIRKGGKDN